jgi:hypothetical protein
MRKQHARRGKEPVKNRSASTFDDSQGWQATDDSRARKDIHAEEDIPGSTYSVPDKFWGFSAVGREDHPGACTACNLTDQLAILLKGSDAFARKSRTPAYVVQPTHGNGLRKATAFELVPRAFRLRRLMLLHENRRIGQLDPDDLRDLRRALQRRFPLMP